MSCTHVDESKPKSISRALNVPPISLHIEPLYATDLHSYIYQMRTNAGFLLRATITNNFVRPTTLLWMTCSQEDMFLAYPTSQFGILQSSLCFANYPFPYTLDPGESHSCPILIAPKSAVEQDSFEIQLAIPVWENGNFFPFKDDYDAFHHRFSKGNFIWSNVLRLPASILPRHS